MLQSAILSAAPASFQLSQLIKGPLSLVHSNVAGIAVRASTNLNRLDYETSPMGAYSCVFSDSCCPNAGTTVLT